MAASEKCMDPVSASGKYKSLFSEKGGETGLQRRVREIQIHLHHNLVLFRHHESFSYQH